MRAHEPALETFATRLCRDSSDARDLVQDTFERAFRAWSRLPADANVRAWLLTILHRLYIDRCRRSRRAAAATAELVELHPTVAPPGWTGVNADRLAQAVASLDDEFRRAFELHALHGCSYKEIAVELGIPVATVGTRLLRARRKLRELLGDSAMEGT